MAYSDMPMTLDAALETNSTHEELYQVGLAYAEGLGVEADLVMAHKWFNLAALKGSELAKEQRRQMSDQMSSDEIKRAQQSAREWLKLMN